MNGDLGALWSLDLNGRPLAAVRDSGVDAAHIDSIGQWWSGPAYFNAGVLLLDLSSPGAARDFAKSIAVMTDIGPELAYGDQDALNIAFSGNWRALSDAWNVQSDRFYGGSGGGGALVTVPLDCSIAHFTGGSKPWLADCYNPMQWLYLSSLLRTDYALPVLRAGRVGPMQIFKAWWRYRRLGIAG